MGCTPSCARLTYILLTRGPIDLGAVQRIRATASATRWLASRARSRFRQTDAVAPAPAVSGKGKRPRALNWLRIAALGAVATFGPAAISWAANLSIGQRDLKFSQSSISIQQGDTIRFSNNDDVDHNLTVRNIDNETEDLGIQRPKAVTSYRFLQRQSYTIVCSIHPRMRIRVIVN